MVCVSDRVPGSAKPINVWRWLVCGFFLRRLFGQSECPEGRTDYLPLLDFSLAATT